LKAVGDEVLGQRVVEVVGVVHARALLEGTDAVVAGFEEGTGYQMCC